MQDQLLSSHRVICYCDAVGTDVGEILQIFVYGVHENYELVSSLSLCHMFVFIALVRCKTSVQSVSVANCTLCLVPQVA